MFRLSRESNRTTPFVENDLCPRCHAITYNAHCCVICGSALPPPRAETLPRTPGAEWSHASREAATPYEGCDVTSFTASSRSNTPDPNHCPPQPSHVERPFTDSPIDAAFPARDDPHQSATRELVLKPILPEVVLNNRYERKYDIPESKPKLVIEQGAKEFPLENLPPEWTVYEHPEGNLYFRHRHRNMNVLTNAYLCDLQTLNSVTACIAKIDNMPQIVEADVLVLELIQDGDNFTCGYYFVHHQSRSLLWFEHFDVSSDFEEIKGATSNAHLKYEVRSQYWRHWETFPGVCDLTDDIVHELREILQHAIVDSLTSDNSTAPYTLDVLQSMLNIANTLRVTHRPPTANSEEPVGYSECFTGRLLATFMDQKFLHYHGQNGARLCRDQSVHSRDVAGPTWLTKRFSRPLFGAPDNHLKDLNVILVDDMVGHVPWNMFVKKLTLALERYTRFSTVILAANMAFLTIGTFSPSRAATIFSFLSVLTSGGGAIIGLLLQDQIKDIITAEAALEYLQNMKDNRFGLEGLAIKYSLPYALMNWGTVLFVVAFGTLGLSQTNSVGCILIGVVLVLVVPILIWSILRSKARSCWLSRCTALRESCQAVVIHCTKYLPSSSGRGCCGSIV